MLRVFEPPEDLVKGIFYGSEGGGTQQRKVRELEKKRAYAAELQAQMQEKERLKQLDRMQRLGMPASGALGSSPHQGPAPANFAAPQANGMLTCDPAAWPPPAANPQQQTVAAYQQQSPCQATAVPPGCYNQGGSYGESPQVAPEADHSPYSVEKQQQLLHSLAAWPDSTPAGAGGTGSQYMAQQQQQQQFQQQQFQQQQFQQQQQQFGMLQQPGPGSYTLYQQQQQQPPYMAMSVAAQHGADTGSPSAGFYSSNSPQAGLRVAPGCHQGMAAAAGAQPWGVQHVGGYAVGPPSGGLGCTIGSSSSGDSPGYRVPDASQRQGYWGPGAMSSSISNPAWSSSPAAAVAAAGPDGKALAAKAKKDAYRAELEAQIRDKAARKAAEKSALAKEEARKEAEVTAYNPWGKGGAGAPLRDASGQVVSDLRGRRGMQGDSPQQMQQHQQQYQHSTYAYNSQGMPDAAGQAVPAAAAAAGAPAAGAACCWAPDDEHLAEPDRYQQQQEQRFAPNAAGSAAAGAPTGAPPLLCFRSDKAFMTADEVERKQQAQRELQKELDQQIQEKKRRKDMEQRQAAAEARKEEERLAAEQAKLAEQFETEQMKQKSKARMTEDVEDQVVGAWTAAKQAAEQDRHKSLGRRRSQAQIPGENPIRNFQQQQQQSSFRHSPHLPSQISDGRDDASPDSQQQQPGMLQFQVQQQQQELDHQQRQQLMMEALQLEEEKMRSMAAQEVERLRSEMQAQASALRDVVERQGGEVAALRAAAAAAEAESHAAKTELAQVRRDFMHKSQELQHETLSTILADYGNGPVSSIAAAYHPSPIRRIELDLPPHPATVRRSVQARAGGLPAAAAGGGGSNAAGGHTTATEFSHLASRPSAVEVLENLLQQGKQSPPGSLATHGSAAAAASGGDVYCQPAANWGLASGRSASLPHASRPLANGVTGPSWLVDTAVGKSTNIRSSMLVSESTFIFPSGLAPHAPAVDEDGNVMEYVGTYESMEEAAAAAAGPAGMEGSSYGMWQQQQPPLQQYQRQTSSAPGSSTAGRTAASGLHTSLAAGRRGLMTPGGSDLAAVVNRNADKLHLLSSLPAQGDPEALDEFLAKFMDKASQPHHRTVATPPSRLMTPPTGSVWLPSRHPSNNSRNLPPRYSNSAADATAGSAHNNNTNCSLYTGLSDTLDQEMSRMSMKGTTAAGAAGSSTSAAAAAAQQRLLSAKGTSVNGYSGAAAADGSDTTAAAAAAEQQRVENSDVSMLGTSQWLPSNGHDEW